MKKAVEDMGVYGVKSRFKRKIYKKAKRFIRKKAISFIPSYHKDRYV
jgi:hypothetical protein